MEPLTDDISSHFLADSLLGDEPSSDSSTIRTREDTDPASTQRPRIVRIVLLALAGITILSLLAGMTFLAYHATYGSSAQVTVYCLAGFFVLLTVPISLLEIVMHLTNWYMPDVQKHVVRILLMVPIYSIQSFLSLAFHSATAYLDTFRDLYEAFVIASFVYYLVGVLGGEDALADILRRKDASLGEHPKILWRLTRTWSMGEEFMLQCKYGVLQFIVIKIVTSFASVFLRIAGLYGEGTFSFTSGYIYIAAILNLSMGWAMYCLIKLFLATKENLRHPKNWHPVGKFLCIKGVVFFTYWQELGLFLLKNAGAFDFGFGSWDADYVAESLQDLLICVEMFFFAIAHRFTFTHREYLGGTKVENYTHDASVAVGRGSSPIAVVDEDDEDGYRGSLPPTVRQLSAPMPVSEALLSSTVPSETFSDIKRLRKGATYVVNKNSNDVLFDINNAESI